VYFAFAAIYIVLSIVFIIDVLRQPPMVLSAVGKVLWIIALLVVPVFAWIVYGFWRIKQSRL
jgi:hypothetical protein